MVRAENSSVSKTLPSGQKVTVVPVRPRGASPTTSSLLVGTPPLAKVIWWCLPSRSTSTMSLVDRAFTTDTPTPCRPPDTL